MQTPCSLLAGLCVNVSRLVPEHTATGWETLLANPATFLTLHGAVCLWLVWNGQSCQGHTGLGSDSDLFRGHSANAERIYLSQVPGIPYAKLDRNGGDDGKGTLSNFPLPIIWKNSSQFVIIPVLLHCLPPAEHITPARLSGIQGPSRKDSLDFWLNTE